MNQLAQIPLSSLTVTFLALTAIIALRYAMISGLFYWLLWGRAPEKVRAIKLMKGTPGPGAVRREIEWSLLSSFIYAAPAAVVIELWKLGVTAVYTDIDAYPLWCEGKADLGRLRKIERSEEEAPPRRLSSHGRN